MFYIVFSISFVFVCLIFYALILTANSKNDFTGQQIYSMVDDCVFCVNAEGPKVNQAGSGFFISEDGIAVTNFHVIKDCTSATIQLNDGKSYSIDKIIGIFEDIAIIKINIEKSKSVKIGNSNKISVGDIVYVIGYPESFVLGKVESTFTQGMISKTSYTYEGHNYIQTTADMTHGNSGGVLLNSKCEVIGITTLMLTDGIVNYMNMAIPINQIEEVERTINLSLQEYYEMNKTNKFYFYSDNIVVGS